MNTADKNQKRSPLKGKPLRQAGQSIQEELNKLIDEELLPYLIAPVFAIVLAGYEWFRWWQQAPPRPYVITVIAIIALVYCIPKFIQIKNRARALKLGRDGEKVVGEYLERLREKGYVVFHDIVGDKFNIDHIVLSNKGIFVIETKTFSKPIGDARIHCDGKRLHVDGLGDQSAILNQISANSRWIKEMLTESTGRNFPIKSVIVFPGWYVDGGLQKDYWVISPKALPKLIEEEKQSIENEDVRLAAYHLSRYIRATA